MQWSGGGQLSIQANEDDAEEDLQNSTGGQGEERYCNNYVILIRIVT